MTFEESLTILPPGWQFSHLIRLGDNDWQALITSTEAVVVGTGSTPAVAILTASHKTQTRTNWLPLYQPGDHAFDDSTPTVDVKHVMKQFTLSLSKPIKRRI